MLKQGNSEFKPIVFWEGFPACGLLLKKVSDEFCDNLIIVATRPAVPFSGLEEMLGHKIIWLDSPDDIWQRREEFSDRNFIVHTGWRYTGWLNLGKYLRQKNNAKVVVVSDNSFRGDLRQILGAIYFRLFLRNHFDGAFTPGKSGQKLLKFFGMPKRRIYSPNYGAYEGIFNETRPISERSNEFLFVGQINKRKALDLIIEAFKEYRKEGGSWGLRISGIGDLEKDCNGEGIILEGFLQPKEVAKRMNSAKVFIFPSRHDNWGTALCEAAACGMNLISSKKTGASCDVLRNGENGILLNKLSAKNLTRAFWQFEKMNDEDISSGSRISKDLAKNFDSGAYYDAFMKMKEDLF